MIGSGKDSGISFSYLPIFSWPSFSERRQAIWNGAFRSIPREISQWRSLQISERAATWGCSIGTRYPSQSLWLSCWRPTARRYAVRASVRRDNQGYYQLKGEEENMNEHQPRVVIVGGVFGGLAAAKALRWAPVEVILIDRTNHHLF